MGTMHTASITNPKTKTRCLPVSTVASKGRRLCHFRRLLMLKRFFRWIAEIFGDYDDLRREGYIRFGYFTPRERGERLRKIRKGDRRLLDALETKKADAGTSARRSR